MNGKKALGSETIARICQVTRQTVARWVKEGKLASFDTAGGQKRVWTTDLIDFLNRHRIAVPPELAPNRPVRVLVVDDEPSVLAIITRVVSGAWPAADIQNAVDGFEAGKKIMEFLPSVVVLDLRLPGADGLHVCRSIRADQALKKTAVLAMSGTNPAEAEEAARAAGADAFLAKPFDSDALVNELEKFLGPPTAVKPAPQAAGPLP